MKTITSTLIPYIQATLGISITLRPWGKTVGLPQFIRERYRFFSTDIMSIECVLMVDTDEGEQAPALISRQMEQIRDRYHVEPIYVRDTITSYNRQRLIERRIPFIVPRNQMYLPLLAIDLREHFIRIREKKAIFSPSTQALTLYVLSRKVTTAITPTEIAHKLGYSTMAMSRAFDELEAAKIVEITEGGRPRYLRFADSGKDLWKRVLPYLNTPVTSSMIVGSTIDTRDMLIAGQSALSHFTMLAEPSIPVYACSANLWKLRGMQERVIELPYPEIGSITIESWKYPPALFNNDGVVDRLPLFLSMKDMSDERVQFALEELLGGMKW